MLLKDVAQINPAANELDLEALAGYSDVWTNEDIREVAAHSAHYLDTLFPEEDHPLPEDNIHVQAR